MTASKIDGNAIARSIRERLGQEVKQKQETNPRYRPSLKIVQGKRPQLRIQHSRLTDAL
jgi:methylenetetrahydrofolate dehydrogenase (NADP+)/methenyltetrahydrofolate cyclohydrolase/formyltetrahydrofolate synthetase